jgi:hypothetical protein
MFQSNLDFENVSRSLGRLATSRENDILSMMNRPDFGSKISDLLELQIKQTYFSVTIGCIQNLNKEIGDSMKGVIQKS